MEDIFSLPQVTEKDKTEHEKGCLFIRDILTRLNLPVLPAHIVSCSAYHPDAATRIEGDKFTVFDYVNTRGQFCFDIGGLFLLLAHKDIVERCIAVIGTDVFPQLVERVRKYRSPYLESLVILPENEVEAYLEELVRKSDIWNPIDLR